MEPSRKKRLAVVHSIAAPYRLHLFRVLWKECERRGWDFFVHFMALNEPDRAHWVPAEGDLPFPHRFWPDCGPTVGQKVWHLNPGLIMHMISTSYDAVLVGGPWDSLTALAVSVFGVRRANCRIGWGESNTHSPGRQGRIARSIKRFLLERYTTIAVPGEEGKKVFESILDGSSRRFVLLPNIVEESLFRAREKFSAVEIADVRAAFGLDPARRFAFWPARLNPEKGIPGFLSEMDPGILGDWQIGIFGSGPLDQEIRSVIDRKGLAEHVKLCGLVKYEKMPRLYAGADLFLLPSWQDPNPLSVVEAMFSGLPVLLSHRVGNFPEALREGINGWGLDPSNPASIRKAAATAFGTSPDRLREMGRESMEVAKGFWETETAVSRFLDPVLG